MGSLTVWHWVVVVVVVLLLFGGRALWAAFLQDFGRAMGESYGDGTPGRARWQGERPTSRTDWYWPVVVTIGLLLLGFLLWQWAGGRP